MRKLVVLFLFALPSFIMAIEFDTLTLQQGLNGYSGCVDVGTLNDQGTKLFGWKIDAEKEITPVSNYRC